jgi:hypothetical protein
MLMSVIRQEVLAQLLIWFLKRQWIRCISGEGPEVAERKEIFQESDLSSPFSWW